MTDTIIENCHGYFCLEIRYALLIELLNTSEAKSLKLSDELIETIKSILTSNQNDLDILLKKITIENHLKENEVFLRVYNKYKNNQPDFMLIECKYSGFGLSLLFNLYH
jgi:hypothetical protein